MFHSSPGAFSLDVAFRFCLRLESKVTSVTLFSTRSRPPLDPVNDVRPGLRHQLNFVPKWTDCVSPFSYTIKIDAHTHTSCVLVCVRMRKQLIALLPISLKTDFEIATANRICCWLFRDCCRDVQCICKCMRTHILVCLIILQKQRKQFWNFDKKKKLQVDGRSP